MWAGVVEAVEKESQELREGHQGVAGCGEEAEDGYHQEA